jgi:hypothetical protein
MVSLNEQYGHYYAQFCDGSKHPARKRIPLGTTVRRWALAEKALLERMVVLGQCDPWAPPKGVAAVRPSPRTFLSEKGPLPSCPRG